MTFPGSGTDGGVRFLAVDIRKANNLDVGIMALVAEAQREAISRRTKEALAAERARGVRRGNLNGAASIRRAGKGAGDLTLLAIAAELTAQGIRTRRGGCSSVGNAASLAARLLTKAS